MKQIKRLCKRFLAFALMLTMVSLPGNVLANSPWLPDIFVFFNGQRMEFDQPPVIVNDRTMVPFRAIFEAFGADIEWDGEQRRITATHPYQPRIVLDIGSERAFVSGQPHYLDAAPFIVAETGRTLVPIRFISEAYGAEVDWDNENRNVIIRTTSTPINFEFDFDNIEIADVPLWEDAEDEYIIGSAFLDPSADDYLGDWHPTFRRHLAGGYYFNAVGRRMSEATYREMLAERDRIVAQIIRPGMSDFEIIRAAHNWLVYNVSYNNDVWSRERLERTGSGWNPNFRHVRYPSEHQFAWSALVHRTTVCAGYADALIYLLEPFGIRAIYVYGPTNIGLHAWNMVRLNNNWYHIDPTWNRQVTNGFPLVLYRWFMISDADLRSQGGSWNWNASRTWREADSPVAPRTHAFNRPVPIWDAGLGRFRNRTAQDDMTFNIQVSTSPANAGWAASNPTSTRPGQGVALNAQANSGFAFERWEVVSGGISFRNQSGTTAAFTMPTNDVHVRAVFRQTEQTGNVTVSVNNFGWGTATASPDTNVTQGSWVSLQADPSIGFEFERWEVVSGTAGIQNIGSASTGFSMPTGNVSVRAVFRQAGPGQTGSVTVSVNNSQWGTATASPNSNVTQGSWVNLQANPNTGFEFDRWEVVSGTANIQNTAAASTGFSMPTGAVSVRAVFRQAGQAQGQSVTVSVNNSQWGSATANPASNVTQGAWVNLQANANTGFEFDRWEVVSGTASIQNTTAASTSFQMPSGAVSVRAVFRQIQTFTVSVSVNNNQAGTATASPNTNVHQADWVNLNAMPNTGFEFDRWEVVSGAITLSDPQNPWASFQMPVSNVSVRAVFRQIQTFTVNVSANDSQAGTATASPNTNVTQGGWVNLQANANTGFEFDRWEVVSGGITLQNPQNSGASFQMSAGDVTVRAIFRQMQTFTVNVNVSPSHAGTVSASHHTNILQGEAVTLQANPNSGYVFSHWEVLSGNISINPTQLGIGFEMPAGDVSLTAVFVPE
ncbi:MAG: hypothetical protein LBE55_01245 [Clostridiales bacterium]|jgi:hypothetical protein|nr:hypothetical protein [Clostridiales bacterium]